MNLIIDKVIIFLKQTNDQHMILVSPSVESESSLFTVLQIIQDFEESFCINRF